MARYSKYLSREKFDLKINSNQTEIHPKTSESTAKRPTSIWSDFGFLGQVGYTITTPIVVGALLGAWIDTRWHGQAKAALIGILVGMAFSAFAFIGLIRRFLGGGKSH